MTAFLTENTTFSSAPCGAKFSAREFGAATVSAGDYKVLSTKAKLFLKGAPPTSCPLVPGSPPPPCTYIPGAAQLMGTGLDVLHTHGKDPLLTDKCRWNCGKGGMISVSDIGVTKNKFLQGNLASVPKAEKKGESAASAAGKDSPAEETQSGALLQKNEPDKKVPPAENTKAETPPLQKEDLHRVLKCRDCEKADRCKKLEEICAKSFETSSPLLRKNYEEAMSQRKTRPGTGEYLWQGHKAHQAYLTAVANEQKKKENWSYAAHHVLSGGQVVKKNKVLLSLFKAFDYDINNVENCVMLLGKADDVSFKELDEAAKKVHKYDCMAVGRLQWHGGHHKYSFSRELRARIEDQLVMRKIRNLEDIKCYAELLTEKLAEIEERWNRRGRVCPKEACAEHGNSQDKQARQDFYEDINGLAEEIRQELTQFVEKPHHNYPWFVSMEAWIYAFGLLHTSKIIAIEENDAGIKLEKFRLTRHGRTLQTTGENLAVEKMAFFLFDNSGPVLSDIKGCVDFCDNVMFFAIQENLLAGHADMAVGLRNCLGFDVPLENVFLLKTSDVEAELTAAQTRLLVWIGSRAFEEAPGACGLKSARMTMAREFFHAGS